MRVRQIVFKGSVENRADALPLTIDKGDAVLVKRGVARSLILRCPCGCGDDLVINLDRRAGPAWRFYKNRKGITLYPSYWRDSHCGSHFILWNNVIFWCSTWDEDGGNPPDELVRAVLDLLSSDEFRSYEEVAQKLDEIPWDVLVACRYLVRTQKAEEGTKKNRGQFRAVAQE